MDRTRPPGETTGRTAFFHWLTPRGQEAFRAVCHGEEPVPSEYHSLKKRHKSDQHIQLNLMARDLFLERGAASVDLFPRPIALDSGGRFDPDLVVILDDRRLYVECERGGPKVEQDRVRKWSNYATVTQEFYLVVPNRSAQRQLVEELDGWAIRHSTRTSIVLRICNLSVARDPDQPLWTQERRLGVGPSRKRRRKR